MMLARLTYSTLAICACINYYRGLDFRGHTIAWLSGYVTFVTIIHLVVWPIFVGTFLQLNWYNLQDEDFKEKFGVLYEDLALKRGRKVIIEPVWFCVRRLLLAMVVCLQQHLWLQVLTFIVFLFLTVLFHYYIRPYKDDRDHIIAIGNEVTICWVFYTILL
jgi:hypothetical protein